MIQQGDSCVTCLVNQILVGDVCTNCTGRTQPNMEGRTCIPCTDTQRSDGAGQCFDCADGTQVDMETETCVECPAPKVGKGGICNVSCRSGVQPNMAKTDCEACTGIEVTDSGLCAPCPSGLVPNSMHTACEQCPGNKYTSSPGVCTECSARTSPDATHTFCSAGMSSSLVETRDSWPCADATTVIFFHDDFDSNDLANTIQQNQFTMKLTTAVETEGQVDASEVLASYHKAADCIMVIVNGPEPVLSLILVGSGRSLLSCSPMSSDAGNGREAWH